MEADKYSEHSNHSRHSLVGVYKRRKKGEGGDVYMTRPGEKPLRSTTDIQRYWGLVPAPTRGVVTDAE